ncbi:MAG TPA: acyl-CoA dehydrogenase family protein, partial [Pseudonocardiaceae bacterium]
MDVFDTPERRALRESVRAFVHRDVVPNLAAWEDAGELPRDLHKTAAALGLL